jgi:preprotein translocase subunit SecG
MVDTILIVIHVLVSLGLIMLVLLHSGRGGGLSDMFGGYMSSSTMGSTTMERNLDRITVTAVVIFAFTSILLAIRLS